MAVRRSLTLRTLFVLQMILLIGTLEVPGFGASLWWHGVSLAAVLVVTVLLWRPFTTSRAFLALGVLASSVLATVSGFWLLYWKEGIRVDGYQDWGVFWHVAWSWAMMVFFALHTWINRRAWLHFMALMVRTRGRTILHVGAYTAVVVAFVVTWSSTGRVWFTNENYIQLSLYAWLVTVLPPFVLWGFVQARFASARSALPRHLRHWPVRRLVDVVLVPTSVLVVLSGIALTFFDAYTDPAGLQYVSKNWHVLPSVLFSMLVFVHSVQAWPTVRVHWRSYGLGRGPQRRAVAPAGRPRPTSRPSGLEK